MTDATLVSEADLEEMREVLAAIVVLGEVLTPAQRKEAIDAVHEEWSARDPALADHCREILRVLGVG